MNLYEVTDGFYGESYNRIYVWALYEDSALDLAEKAYGKPRSNLKIRFLFSGSMPEFATRPSDSGFTY